MHRGLYNFETITLEFFRDSNTLFEAFKTGLLDLRIEIDPTKWREGYDIAAVKDGRIIREAIPIRAPKGMSGFIFNTRKPVFSDLRVREAMFSLFDFEWLNKNLFAGVYRRTSSFFDESELSFHAGPVDAREAQILGLVAQGLTTKEIARNLAISPRTIETHRTHIGEKLGVGSVAEMVKLHLAAGEAAAP